MNKVINLLIILVSIFNCLCLINQLNDPSSKSKEQNKDTLINYIKEEKEIENEAIYEIDQIDEDVDYLYKTITAKKTDPDYYFSYTSNETLEVHIGAFRIELAESSTGKFSDVVCTFVDRNADEETMIKAIEDTITKGNSYCIGAQNVHYPKRYNYIFKYEYQDQEKAKKMVIKVDNKNGVAGDFTIYMLKNKGETIQGSDFEDSIEYGKNEYLKKSLIPYIVDLEAIRKYSEMAYISKVLFYSQYMELQMYYVPEDSNAPIKLFCGNIALVYTKPELAIQKYHATTLVLFTESLDGQTEPYVGVNFRFHTQMFKSEQQIEFFVSQNENGRTLNYPLSIEMNTCSDTNNKLYYIVNYNKQEDLRVLHLDMIFGSYSKARIAREINGEKWESLLEDSMVDIVNYQIELPSKKQHLDVIEIECKSPLLLNAYYVDENAVIKNVKRGEIVVKELPSKKSFTFTIDKTGTNFLYYSMSLFSPTDPPSVTVRFPDGKEHYFEDNTLAKGQFFSVPDNITVINNNNVKTRFIFKYGFGVSKSEGWEDTKGAGYEGRLYYNEEKKAYIYKFPFESYKYNFTKVNLQVTPKKGDENIKFCYSTNLGVAIEASKENCFRTGKKIPYNLTFLNPLVLGKNYETDEDAYFIYLSPLDGKEISIGIKEDTYETGRRNSEGQHTILSLDNGKVGAILSLSKKLAYKMIIQFKSCTKHEDPITYIISDALSRVEIIRGKIYQRDQFGVVNYISSIYTEKEIYLSGEAGAEVFTKHTALKDNYTPKYTTRKISFDESTNTVSIEKPTEEEEYTITIIIGKKGELSHITQCMLATEDKSQYGDYSRTFVSSPSTNVITRFIDFFALEYKEGDEFDLLVYAEQNKNSKMEFMYEIFSGKVGKVQGVKPITDFIDNKYASTTFSKSASSNYLYYDFAQKPTGNIASLKIISTVGKVTKVGCVFTSLDSDDSAMIKEVNEAIAEGKSVCLGEMQKDSDGYDALINAKYTDKKRLVIQVIYGFGNNDKIENEEDEMTINIRITGEEVGQNEGKYGEDEPKAPIPYVIDLLKIREKKIKDSYVSKVLFYSQKREMQMFYLDESSSTPISLFSGNIMLVYTNEELIKQKYHGATTMILLTDSLNSIEKVIPGEQYRFSVKHFDTYAQIQYFISGDTKGRVLNNPTAVEMTNCTLPYYYILNYNTPEDKRRTLHLDTIYGEKRTIKIATSLNSDNWDSLVEEMEVINGEERILVPSTEYHFDVMEITCNLPILLNIYYADPYAAKISNLDIGDISILSLGKGQSETLYFKNKIVGPFTYSFNIYKDSKYKPNIRIDFDSETSMECNENGVFVKDSLTNYENMTITNLDAVSSDRTRIIFKFGYVIEAKFQKIENEVYSNQNDGNRTINLFGYKYETTNHKYNITGIDFKVSTNEDNVKFCYSTNLGTFINPSLQNCFRVGKKNPYTISTLNPLVMYKHYYSGSVGNYYVGFRTEKLDQNITITPIKNKYDTTERNMEGAFNKITLPTSKEYSTILTAPKGNEQYLFTQIQVCTRNNHLRYSFLNAYNRSNLGYDGEIPANSGAYYKSIENTKLDTELKLYGAALIQVFVKHLGLNEKYQPELREIKGYYNNITREFNWTQPIKDEDFKYKIYIDKYETIKNKQYTLCNITELVKPEHYEINLRTSSDPVISIPEFEYKDMDFIIIAEQVNNGQIILLSRVFDSFNHGGDPTPIPDPGTNNVGLVVLISIVSVAIVAGVIVTVIICRKYKSKGEITKKNKETSMALITGTNSGKMIDSQAQETSQIDP